MNTEFYNPHLSIFDTLKKHYKLSNSKKLSLIEAKILTKEQDVFRGCKYKEGVKDFRIDKNKLRGKLFWKYVNLDAD